MSIFLVNQTDAYKKNIVGDYLWAPKLDKVGHKNRGYELMKKIHKGDFILNNAGSEIVAISIANEDCKSKDQPQKLQEAYPDRWMDDGWYVPISYYSFSHPLKNSDFRDWIQNNPDKDSAFNKDGVPKEQYLCNLSPEHAKHILEVALKLESDPQVKNVLESALFSTSESQSGDVDIVTSSPSTFAAELADQLRLSRNLLLHGAPGTGKTYLARQVASLIAGDKDRIKFVQFYPGYDYSNFIEGYKPIKGNEGSLKFKLIPGVFKEFVDKAKDDSAHKFVFIIDEINRGNISSIFGEVFSALEPSERGRYKVTLQYSGEEFSLPSNVYLIGTMNDIDRSAEPLDFAFRRRWDFIEITPEKTADDIFKTINDKSAMLRMENLNDAIKTTSCLGDRYQIGGSYFLKLNILKSPERLWEYDLEPLLKEYLRGVYDGAEILDRLHTAYTI